VPAVAVTPTATPTTAEPASTAAGDGYGGHGHGDYDAAVVRAHFAPTLNPPAGREESPSPGSPSTQLEPAAPATERAPVRSAHPGDDPGDRRQSSRQDRRDAPDVLDPHDEIPIRLSLTDRAGADLAGSWRIVVTSLFAGSGATTVTAALGLVFADVRGHGVVAVDTDAPRQLPGGHDGDGDEENQVFGVSLARRLGAPAATTVSTLARRRRESLAPEQVASLVSVASANSGPRVLDVVTARRVDSRHATGGAPGAVVPVDDVVTPTAFRSALGVLGEAYSLILLDAAGDSPLTPSALQMANIVLLVVLASPADLDAAVAELRDPDGMPCQFGDPRPIVVAVVVSARRGRWSPQTRAAAARLRRRVDLLVRVPYDTRLDADAGSPTKIGRLRRSSRRAFLSLAADVVDILAEEADGRVAGATRTSAPGENLATP
jgi:cellulose biosynthesis protein BcsQ